MENNRAAIEAAKTVKQTGDNFVNAYNNATSGRVEDFIQGMDKAQVASNVAKGKFRSWLIGTVSTAVVAITCIVLLPIAVPLLLMPILGLIAMKTYHSEKKSADNRVKKYALALAQERGETPTTARDVSRRIYNLWLAGISPHESFANTNTNTFERYTQSLSDLSEALPKIDGQSTHFPRDGALTSPGDFEDPKDFRVTMLNRHDNLMKAANGIPEVSAALAGPKIAGGSPGFEGGYPAVEIPRAPHLVDPSSMTMTL